MSEPVEKSEGDWNQELQTQLEEADMVIGKQQRHIFRLQKAVNALYAQLEEARNELSKFHDAQEE